MASSCLASATTLGICVARSLQWVLFAVPISLLLLRITSVFFEPYDSPKEHLLGPWNIASLIGYAIIRRIDDGSFWTSVAIWMSATLTMEAFNRSRCRDRPVTRGFTLALGSALALVIVGIWLYVLAMQSSGGTFYWRPDQAPWTLIQIRVVKCLQCIEGALQCLVIIGIGATVFFSMRTVRSLTASRWSTHPIATAKAATLIVRACLTPFAAVSLFFAATHFIIEVLKLSEYGKSSTRPAIAIGYFVIYASPFMLVLGYALIHWRRSAVISSSWVKKPSKIFGLRVVSTSAPKASVADDSHTPDKSGLGERK